MNPPWMRSELGLNGSDPKSGSPPDVTSNVRDAADPAPVGFLTTKQWNAAACPAVASASTRTARSAMKLRRMFRLSSPPAPLRRRLAGILQQRSSSVNGPRLLRDRE